MKDSAFKDMCRIILRPARELSDGLVAAPEVPVAGVGSSGVAASGVMAASGLVAASGVSSAENARSSSPHREGRSSKSKTPEPRGRTPER